MEQRRLEPTIRATAGELRAIALSCDDAAGYFPALYARVTTQIADSIDRGDFADGPRMDAFATEFASRYVRARKQEIVRPRCWQATWDVANDQHLLIVQHLFLGINAHVNYDLPQAVVAIARRTGDLASVHPDFDAVNDVLATTSVGVLRDLDRLTHWTNAAVAMGGGRLFNFSLREARSQAWAAAERLYSLDDAQQRAYVSELDELVSVLAYLITQPPLLVQLFVFVARMLEQHDPGVVIAALLGDAGTSAS
jgi:hypothetical protein